MSFLNRRIPIKSVLSLHKRQILWTTHQQHQHQQRFNNSNSSDTFDLAVIGGGPGGYSCAIKAAQLGLKTVCVEGRGTLGGTCLNVGCIPSKSLLHSTHLLHEAQHKFASRGININGDISVDIGKMMQMKDKTVTVLTKGIEGLFKKNKVTYEKGWANLKSANEITITNGNENENKIIQSKNIVVATGSVSSNIPGVIVDETDIVSSTGALSFTHIPDSLLVVGAGVIGLELGSVWARLGTKVTVVEFLDRILPGVDVEISSTFEKMLKKQGFEIKLSTGVSSVSVVSSSSSSSTSRSNIRVSCTDDSVYECEKLLVAIGRQSNTDSLGLDASHIGIETDKQGRVLVRHPGSDWRTLKYDHIYAIGDCIQGPMLAHKSEEEGIAVAEIISGKTGHVNYNCIPSVIYTHPEIASVGQTEEQLQQNQIKYKVGKFPFLANSRAKTNDDSDGFVKILADSETDRLLGVHIIGPNAGEMIAEGVIGLEYGASAEDLARTCHAHPTLSEAFKEACMAACGMNAIHF